MSGFYSNWTKIQNPDFTNNNVQMQSGGSQVPFYFGGSNVPTALGIDAHIISGSGINSVKKYDFHPIGVGKIKQTTTISGGNIHIPRKLRRV